MKEIGVRLRIRGLDNRLKGIEMKIACINPLLALMVCGPLVTFINAILPHSPHSSSNEMTVDIVVV